MASRAGLWLCAVAGRGWTCTPPLPEFERPPEAGPTREGALVSLETALHNYYIENNCSAIMRDASDDDDDDRVPDDDGGGMPTEDGDEVQSQFDESPPS